MKPSLLTVHHVGLPEYATKSLKLTTCHEQSESRANNTKKHIYFVSSGTDKLIFVKLLRKS